MEPFTALKFRTMKVDTDQEAHREYVRSIATSGAVLTNGSKYKLDRNDAVTSFGRWLRQDEPRRAAAVGQRPTRRDVDRGPPPLHPVRGRELPAPSPRAVPRAAGDHRPLAGGGAGELDLRRGARDGRCIRPRLVARSRPAAALQDTVCRCCASAGRLHERARQGRRRRARLLGPEPRPQPRRARSRRRRRRSATRGEERLELVGRRFPAVRRYTSYTDDARVRRHRRGRDRDARVDPPRPRDRGARVRQARIHREAARGLVRTSRWR